MLICAFLLDSLRYMLSFRESWSVIVKNNGTNSRDYGNRGNHILKSLINPNKTPSEPSKTLKSFKNPQNPHIPSIPYPLKPSKILRNIKKSLIGCWSREFVPLFFTIAQNPETPQTLNPRNPPKPLINNKFVWCGNVVLEFLHYGS